MADLTYRVYNLLKKRRELVRPFIFLLIGLRIFSLKILEIKKNKNKIKK